jgi:hypothetical protein
VYLDGKDVTNDVIERLAAEARGGPRWFDPELIGALRMVPSSYLHYFYHQQVVLQRQREGGQSRGEQVRDRAQPA